MLACSGIVACGLFYFKYGNSPIVPLGLSFYTLKIISYVVDVYKGELEAVVNPIYYFDYALFFPCITAGPINKAKPFIEELKNKHWFEYTDLATGGFRLAFGLFEKMVFCDFVATVVNRSLDNVELFGMNVLLGIVLYSFEIYLDFDSYSNIALGVSRMLGFKLDENFKVPYLSSSIKEFWNRWHISLSTWLKDYVYIPLGGSKKGLLRKYLAIIVVFVVSAIWHGTTINFLYWGLGHAIVRIIEDFLYIKLFKKIENKYVKFGLSIVGIALNFAIVTGLWMLFKYPNFSELTGVINRLMVDGTLNFELIGLTKNEIEWLMVIISLTVLVDVLRYFFDIFEFMGKRIFVLRWVFYVAFILAFLVFGVYGGTFDANDFIYRWF